MTNRTLFSETDENVVTILAQLDHLRTIHPPAFPVNSPAMSAQQIATIIETTYWSSLLASEGRYTSVRIAAATRTSFVGLPQFSAPVPFDESHIAKLAPAVPPRGCLLVDPATLQIFAICRQPLSLDATLTVEVVRPGVIQVGVGVYRTFVVFAGRETTLVLAAGKIDLAQSIRTALRVVLPADDFLETQAVWREALALTDVARAVRTNGHGGALLFAHEDDDTWSESIHPFRFRLDARDGAIPDSIRAELKTTTQAGLALQALWQSTLSDADKFRNCREIHLGRFRRSHCNRLHREVGSGRRSRDSYLSGSLGRVRRQDHSEGRATARCVGPAEFRRTTRERLRTRRPGRNAASVGGSLCRRKSQMCRARRI